MRGEGRSARIRGEGVGGADVGGAQIDAAVHGHGRQGRLQGRVCRWAWTRGPPRPFPAPAHGARMRRFEHGAASASLKSCGSFVGQRAGTDLHQGPIFAALAGAEDQLPDAAGR
jgi:hypothetical protein